MASRYRRKDIYGMYNESEATLTEEEIEKSMCYGKGNAKEAVRRWTANSSTYCERILTDNNVKT